MHIFDTVKKIKGSW